MFSKKIRLISLIPLLTFGLINGCQQTTSSNNPTIIIPTVQEVAGNPDAAGPTPTDLAVITLAAPSTATVPNASATESAPLPTPDLTLTAAPFLPTRNPVPTRPSSNSPFLNRPMDQTRPTVLPLPMKFLRSGSITISLTDTDYSGIGI